MSILSHLCDIGQITVKEATSKTKPSMKLSSFQIDALVSQIVKKQELQYQKECENLRNQEKKKGLAKKYAKIIQQIPEEVRRKAYLTGYNEKYFLDKMTDYKKAKSKWVDRHQIKQDILIASIGANDLQELRSKINYEF